MLDSKSRDDLIVNNIALVKHIASHSYFDRSGQLGDIISVGVIGLIKAVDTYNPQKHTKLATYIARCVRNEINSFLRNEARAYGKDRFDIIPLHSMDYESAASSENIEDSVLCGLILHDFLDQLGDDAISKNLFLMAFGKFGEKNYVAEISRRYGMNKKEIHVRLKSLRASFLKYYKSR